MRIDVQGLRRGTVAFALLIASVSAILARGAYLRGADSAALAIFAAGGLLLGGTASGTFMRWRRRHPVADGEIRGSRWAARIPRGAFVSIGIAAGAVAVAASRGRGGIGAGLVLAFLGAGTAALLVAGLMLKNTDYAWMDEGNPELLEAIAHDSRDPAVGEAWKEAPPYQRVMLVAVGLTVAAMVAAAAWVALR